MLAYLLFRDKGITPGEFYRMPPGEKLILTAFVHKMYDIDGGTVRRIGADEQ